MKRLILMRHGHALPALGERADFERPLSGRGERDAQLVAERLLAAGWIPERIVASAAPRALATANILARAMSEPALVVEDELYLAGGDLLRRAILRHGGDSQTIALVGHNPGMTLLIRDLAEIYLDDLPTAGVAGIEFEGLSWRALGEGRLGYFDAPLLQR